MRIAKTWVVLTILTGGISLGFMTGGCSNQEETPPGDVGAAVKPYPLKTCLVSGEELGSMGKPVVYVHEGQEIKFCCSDCVDEFKKDPQKYVAKLTAKAAPDAPKTE